MTLMGFEVQAAKPKGERAPQDEPSHQPIRPGEKSPADRRNLTNDERTVKRRRRRVHAAFSGPGYYLVDKDGAPQSQRFETLSEAEAQLQPESGELMQYLNQAPNSSQIAEPWPANLNQVNGSLSMSARTDDEFAFEAAMGEEDQPDEEEGGEEKTAAVVKEASWGHSEADLLAAMAKASGPEQQRLMGELEGLRRQARRKVMAEREIDLADAYIHASLTPVRVHEHHTAATDWIEEVAEPDLGAPAVHRAMVVEAQQWAAKVSPAVKEDREEYFEQACGVARLAASAMGPHREMAFQTFMKTAQDAAAESGAGPMPWSAPPVTLPPVGGGDAPFGVPSGGGPLNGQNLNPMATEVYPGAQVLPLDNGASVWPPADNLEGEAPLPPVAPDNYNAVGADTHMSSLRISADYDPEQAQLFQHMQNQVQDLRNRGISRSTAEPTLPCQHCGAEADFDRHYASFPSSYANYVCPECHQETHYKPGTTRDQVGRTAARHQASEAFNGPKQSYAEYQARLSEGSTPLDEEHFAGSLAAVSPAPSNSVIPVTGMLRWAERGTNPDPQGADLAGNPMAGYPEGGNWDKDQAHAQSGEAQSGLPLAPQGPQVAEHLDWITDFPDTGPAEVPSDRAPNVAENESQAGHGSGKTQTAARIPDAGSMTFNPDPGYADEYRLDDALGTDQYMSEIPHDFEPSGNSQYCMHCGESRRHPMHVYARRLAAEQGKFKVDRSSYPMAPQGDAAATAEYEQAYSSDRQIDYSETGIGPLGTVPVQGYGVNPSGEMFTWQIGPPGPRGANDVANVPTPGAGTMGAPQPTGVELPEGKEARLRAFQSRVAESLRNKENQWSNPETDLGDDGSDSDD